MGITLFVICLGISATLFFMRDKILGIVVSEVNKNLNAPVKVGDISLTFWASFPSVSVDFNDIYVHDALTEAKVTDTLFYSERIRLKFNPLEILKKQYRVKEVEVSPGYAHIKQLADGRVNYDIIRANESSKASSFSFSLNQLNFHGFRAEYSDYVENQFYELTLDETSVIGEFSEKNTHLQIASYTIIKKIQSGEVKLLRNTTAKLDFALNVDQVNHVVSIAKAPILIANLPFTLEAYIAPSKKDIRIQSNKVLLTDIAKNLHHSGTQKIKDFRGTGELQFNFHLLNDATTNGRNQIACNFGIQNGSIMEPSKGLRISKINLQGEYSNSTSKKGEYLNLKRMSFETPAGPFSGNLLIANFAHPSYQGDAIGQIDLGVVQAIFPIEAIASTSGKVQINSAFDIRSQENEYKIKKCEGNALFSNVQLQLKDDKRYFDHISGLVYLKNDNIGLDHLSLTVGKSDLMLTGEFSALQDYLNAKGKLGVGMNINSVYLDVQDFSTSTKADEIADGRNFILPNNIDAKVHLVANNLTYDKHEFKKLNADMTVEERKIRFDNLTLQNAKADIVGNVIIDEKSPEIFTIKTHASSDNIFFKPLFKEWDNFQQDVISADNVNGIAQVKMDFEAPFDLRSGIVMKAIQSKVYLKIEQGSLKNVSTFKSITESLNGSAATRMILKKNNIQNFEKELLDLKFETIENTFTIANGQLIIPNMYIASNALDINLSGSHTFDNQIDYKMDFNFRDLRKAERVTEFGLVEDDGTGFRLFVRMFGPLDNPTIKWDQEAKRELAKANFENEKQTTKAILKAELGLFKRDTTVTAYKAPTPKPKEEIKVYFGKEEEEVREQEEAILAKKKETKLSKTMQKWKEQAEKDKTDKIGMDFQ